MKTPPRLPLLLALAATMIALGATQIGRNFNLEIIPPSDRTAVNRSPGAPLSTASDDMTLRLTGEPGEVYRIEHSADGQRWKPILALTMESNIFEFIDPERARAQSKFYRATKVEEDDISDPTWPSSVRVSVIRDEGGSGTLTWTPASDDIGIARYEILRDGVVVDSVMGNIHAWETGLDSEEATQFAIRAVDAHGKQSPPQPVVQLPVFGLTAVGDDNARVYAFTPDGQGGYTALTLLEDLTGSRQRGIGVGDFTGDGILDIMGASDLNSRFNLFLFEGRQDGTFEPSVPLPVNTSNVSSYIMDSAMGDFDRNGFLDYVVNANNGNTAFFFNYGRGHFTTNTVSWESAGRAMDAADFNGDGILDLMRATWSNGHIRIRLGNGNGTFTDTGAFYDVGGDPYGGAAGDFNNDGFADIIASEGGSGNISYLTGDGTGNFTFGDAPTILDVNNHGSFDAFDYNLDGNLDFVISAWSSRRVYVYLGNGDGTFQSAIEAGSQPSSSSMAVAAPPPPEANVSISPDVYPSVAMGGNITFTFEGEDVDPLGTYQWTYSEDANVSLDTLNATFTFNAEGFVNVVGWHTATDGTFTARGANVSVTADPPVANAGGPYTFDESAASDGSWTATLNGSQSTDDFGIVSYLWDFGDGTTSTEVNPTKTWNARTNPDGDPWPVSLTVTDVPGQTHTDNTTVTFNLNDPPVAAITAVASANESFANQGDWFVPFSASTSTDDFGLSSYAWSLPSGVSYSSGNASSESPTLRFANIGNYTIALTVTDNALQTDNTTFDIEIVQSEPPVANFTGPLLVDESFASQGEWTATYDGTVSTDDYNVWDWDWNWGDGQFTNNNANPTHSWTGVGVYNVTLTVQDDAGQTNSTVKQVQVVANELPVANITVGDTNVEGAAPIVFNGSLSTDDFGIFRYNWIIPESTFPFYGNTIDQSEWVFANFLQAGRLQNIGTNSVSWGTRYIYSNKTKVRREGGSFEARVDTTTLTGYMMVGFRDPTSTSTSFTSLPYAIYFRDGEIRIYESGSYRGDFALYTPGLSYEVRIELLPDQGALYYYKAFGAEEWIELFETDRSTADLYTFGAVTTQGQWGLDDFKVTNAVLDGVEVTTPLFPTGNITLEVTDNALQTTNSTVEITTIVGEPPVAVIEGPEEFITGVRLLSFDGSNSTDDYGIASYEWDFGDGGIAAGEIVSHYFRGDGEFNVTLTVYDFAGQTDSATFTIFVEGPRAVTAVPWRFAGDIELPHETWDGNQTTLKAVAQGSLVPPINWTWDPGDGSPVYTGTITSANRRHNIEARHFYFGTDGTPYTATISVEDADGTVGTDSYLVLVREKSIEVEINHAIDEGLWYLHKTQILTTDLDINTPQGYWPFGSYESAPTASAMQAFFVNGHKEDGNPNEDPYVVSVAAGMNYLFTRIRPIAIDDQVFGDPDANGNGIGIEPDDGREPYQLGQIIDAIVTGGTPDYITRTGGVDVFGRTYADIVQDMVDTYVWGSYDDTGTVGGGWRYSWNQFPDNSANQWGAIGLLPAEDIFGSIVPQWVKDRTNVWTIYSQNSSTGALGYTSTSPYIATTPSGMVQLAWVGVETDDPRWLEAENYLITNSSNGFERMKTNDDFYALYALTKAMRLANPEPRQTWQNGFDWFLDETNGLARYLIEEQLLDGSSSHGSWLSRNHINRREYSSAFAIMMLSSSLFREAPVAVINARPNPVGIGVPVTFDGSFSFHQDPSYDITEYRWDFDASDGIDFTSPDALGPVVTHAYPEIAPYTVTLRVGDNHEPPDFDTATVIINVAVPPHAPTADPAGPYIAAVGEDVELNGEGSFDIDEIEGDRITAWDWEIDFLQPLDFDDLSGSRVLIEEGFDRAGIFNIGLRVTDDTEAVFPETGFDNRTDTAFTTVTVYNLLVDDLVARTKGNKAQLTWTKKGDFAKIYRSEIGPNTGFVEIGETDSSFATFLDEEIDLNKDYYYRVHAFNNGSRSILGISPAEFIYSRDRGDGNRAPLFTSAPILGATVDNPYLYIPTYFDREDDAVTFSVVDGPAGFVWDGNLDGFTFTPNAGQLGPHNVSIRVADAGGEDIQNYELIVFPGENIAPVAEANGPYVVLLGEPINFSSNGTLDANGDELRYIWNFADSNVSTEANPVYTYGAAGDYIITLVVNDGAGGTARDTAQVTVLTPNRPPAAVLAGGPTFNVRLGESITLDASESEDLDGDSLSYTYDLGNGTILNDAAEAVTVVYDAVGSYNGSLTVDDGEGGNDTVSFRVDVDPANQAPTADIVVAQSGLELRDRFIFDALASSDPEGDPLTYEWDFGDGFSTRGPLVSHGWRTPGTFNVTLTVTDGRGGSDTATTEVFINAPPVFESEPPPSALQDEDFNYTLTVTDGDGDPLVVTFLEGPDGMVYDETNGTLDWTPGNSDVGDNLVVLEAVDQTNGTTVQQVFNLVVENVNDAPEIFTIAPTFAVAEEPFIYNVNAFDIDGDPLVYDLTANPANMTIDSTSGEVTWAPLESQVGQNVTMTIEVSDPFGATDVQTTTLLILDGEQPPIAVAGDDITVFVGTEVTLLGNASFDPNNDPIEFQWAFLSTPPESGFQGLGIDAVGFTFTPDRPGEFLVELLVKDATGLWSAPDTVVVTAELAPLDLEPRNLSLAETTFDPATGRLTGNVTVEVYNLGGKSLTTPYATALFIDEDNDQFYDPDLDTLLNEVDVPDIPADGTFYILTLPVNANLPFNGAPVAVYVDRGLEVEEEREDNNYIDSAPDCDPEAADCIDLTASLLRVDRSDLPDTAAITVRVANAGTEEAPAGVVLTIYQEAEGLEILGSISTTEVLPAGSFVDMTFNWLSPEITVYQIVAIVDPLDVIPEIDETNNRVEDPNVDLTRNDPPVADAGEDRDDIFTGDDVILNGSGSSDPEGKPLTYSWDLLSFPAGSIVGLDDPSSENPAFRPDLPGWYTFELTVSDGLQDSLPDYVNILATEENPNSGPTITSSPPFAGMVDVLYHYQVTATDPDNDTLSYELSNPPANMTISAGGLIEWTPDRAGSFPIQVRVSDGRGATVVQGYTLTILPFENLAPEINSTPLDRIQAGETYTYNPTATDINGDTLTWILVDGPANATLTPATGAITWATTEADIGAHSFVIRVDDTEPISDTQSWTVVVVRDSVNSPVVGILADRVVEDPEVFPPINLDQLVDDPNYADNELTWTVEGNSSLNVTIDENRVARISYEGGLRTTEEITFLVENVDGFTGFATAQFTVRGPDNPPVAAFSNLATDRVNQIRSGLFDLQGTADDPDAIDQVSFRLTLYNSNGEFVADFTPEPRNADGFFNGRVEEGDSLAELDFGLIRNGTYDLYLDVRSGSRRVTEVANIALQSELKSGRFSFMQRDVVIPVNGVPLTVTRSYDSTNTTSGDFGRGWTYNVTDVEMEINETRTETTGLFGEEFSLRIGGSRDVTLTMPDTGERVTFRYDIVPGGFLKMRAVWRAPRGVQATLRPLGSDALVTLFSLPPYWEAAGMSTGVEEFDFPGYILTTKDGTQYRIERRKQGDFFLLTGNAFTGNFVSAYAEGYVTEIRTRAGEVTEIDRVNGGLRSIDAFDILGNPLRTLKFVRDAQNRITNVFDPSSLDEEGNPVGPAAVVYEYDDAFDRLTDVYTLRDDSDLDNLVYDQTTFVYGDINFPYYITEIITPNGISPVKTVYDEDGKIIATIDAFGNRTEFVDNPAARTQTVFDTNGRPTVNVYDNNGNIISTTDPDGRTTLRTFDEDNNLLSETDALGNTTTFAYDQGGNQILREDPLGNRWTSTYDAFGNILSRTDPLGRTERNEYDSAGRLIKTINKDGTEVTREYDDKGNILREVDGRGNETLYTYDTRGNRTSMTDRLGHVTTFEHDANGNQIARETTRTTPDGIQTLRWVYRYDRKNRLIYEEDPRGGVRTQVYSPNGRRESITNKLGMTTLYEYTPGDLPSLITYPDGSTERFLYDTEENLIRKINRDGNAINYRYDSANRLAETIHPDGTRQLLEYDDAGRIIKTIDERGFESVHVRDAAGRRLELQEPESRTNKWEYDAVGLVTKRTNANNRETTYLYDERDRLIRTTYHDGTFSEVTYDANDNKTSETDQAGRTTRYEYDAMDRLVKVIDAMNVEVSYAYDEVGNLIARTDGNGHTTRFEYDGNGNKTKVILPLLQEATMEYDAMDRMTRRTDFNGVTITYTYDNDGRVTSKRYSDGTIERVTYTPEGLVLTETDARGTTTFTYDGRDRLLSRVDPNGEKIQYTYNDTGNLTSVKTPAGTTSYTYDDLGRLETVTDRDNGTTTYSYYAQGNRDRVTYANGTYTDYDYDALDRLILLSNRRANNSVISSFDYTLGNAGNRTQVIEEDGRTVDWEYDENYRLVKETITAAGGGSTVIEYTYDNAGNRLTKLIDDIEVNTYSYDDNDRLLSDGIHNYTYDDGGNLRSKIGGGLTQNYTYDFNNRLATVSSSDAGLTTHISHTYDFMGNLVGKTVDGDHTRYLIDRNRLLPEILEERSASGTLLASYTFGDDLLSMERFASRSYYLYDGHLSTRELTDGAGNVTDSYEYDAFGLTLASTGSTTNPHLYTGERADPATGLYYLRARHYAPTEGRFLTRDEFPVDIFEPGTLHKYTYVENDPVNMVDPNGEFASLAGVMVSISISTNIRTAYTKNLAKGFFDIMEIAFCIIEPGYDMQNVGLAALFEGGGDWSFRLIELGREQVAIGFKQIGRRIKQIYTDTAFGLVSFEGKFKKAAEKIWGDLQSWTLDQLDPGNEEREKRLKEIAKAVQEMTDLNKDLLNDPEKNCENAKLINKVAQKVIDKLPD